GVATSLETSRLVLFHAIAESSSVPFAPALKAYTGEPFGALAKTMPAPETGDGTRRQCVIRSGFHVPQRQNSSPSFTLRPALQSPPVTSNSVRPVCSKGIGVL